MSIGSRCDWWLETKITAPRRGILARFIDRNRYNSLKMKKHSQRTATHQKSTWSGDRRGIRLR
jgi:hypothetical protein